MGRGRDDEMKGWILTSLTESESSDVPSGSEDDPVDVSASDASEPDILSERLCAAFDWRTSKTPRPKFCQSQV